MGYHADAGDPVRRR